MSHPKESPASILVASDRLATANLVKKYLEDEFDDIQVSTNAASAAADFDRYQADVLILAFNSVEQAKRHHQLVQGADGNAMCRPHRTIVLCNQVQSREAYELCRDGGFDDYSLFWPINPDSHRLSLAVHHAFHDLAAAGDAGPTPAEFARQVSRLADLEALLKERMTQGGACIESTGRAMTKAAEDIGVAFDGFSRRLVQGDLAALVMVRDATALEQAFDRHKQEHIEAPLRAASESVKPLQQWVLDLQEASQPHLESIRRLRNLADQVHPTVMVVDDEKFQFQFVSRLLKDEPYRLVFATGGVEAIKQLGMVRPDVLLIDLTMPRMGGLEVIRWMKGSARYHSIPIILITSNSEESVVEASFKAGASDFLVKPLLRESLISKITAALEVKEPPPVEPFSDLDASDV